MQTINESKLFNKYTNHDQVYRHATVKLILKMCFPV